MSNDQGSYVALAESWADDPWFRFPRAFIRDSRLSGTARAIAAWMASHSSRFRFDVPAMVKANLGGRDKIRKALKELEQYGYLVRVRERNSDGLFGRILYVLHPVPQRNPSSGPAPENQGMAPAPENQSLGSACEDTTKPQVGTGDWKPGPDFQGSYKGDQGEVEQGSKNREGEEGDARGRASDVSSPGDNSGWAVRGERDQKSSLAAADLIRAVAKKVLTQDEGLTVDEFQLLARLADEVRPVVDAQPALGWDEYVAWLYQGWVRPDGRKSYKTFSGALRWRLLPEQVQKHAVPWAVDRRAAQTPSEAHGGREKPDLAAKGAEGAMHETRCAVHGTMTMGGRCQPCDRQAAEEERRYQEEQQAAEEAAAAEAGEEAPVSAEDDAMVAKMIEELHRTREAAAERARKEKEATRAKLEALRKGAEKETLQRAL